MNRLAQLFTIAALASSLLPIWQDSPGPIVWPHLLPPLFLGLAQMGWLWHRPWLSRGLSGLTLIMGLVLSASYLTPESWIGIDSWNDGFTQWLGIRESILQRPPLLWLATLVLLALNLLLRLRLGLGSPVLLVMAAILTGTQAVMGWHVSAIQPIQAYAALPREQLTVWLLCLAQLACLMPALRRHAARLNVPLMMGAGVMLIAMLWWQQQAMQTDRQLYLTTQQEGQRLADRLNLEIRNQLGAMRRFASFWELLDQPPTQAQWQRQVVKYQNDYPYFQDIGFITPEGVIRWVYPYATNHRLIGTRLFEAQPEGKAALRRALLDRQEAQAGIVDLLQEGKGMIVYIPIVAADDDRLLGAASMVLRLDMLTGVLLNQINNGHLAVTLTDHDSLLVRTGPFGHLTVWSHRYAIDTGAQTLTLTTRPDLTYLLQTRARLPELTLVVALMLAYLLYQLLYAQRRLGLEHREAQRANADLLDEVATRTRLQQEVEWLARHDELTDLPNRRLFMEYIKDNQATLPLTVLICDIDHFKRINDRMGHLIGDRYLEAFGARARPVVEEAGGLMARYGGEEFVACLPGCSLKRGQALAERLRQAMVDTDLKHEDGQPVTLSIGVASVAQGPLDLASLMQRADEALYRAKATGRNRVTSAVPA